MIANSIQILRMSARTASIKKIKYERVIKEKSRKGKQVDVANSDKTKKE